MPRLQALYSKHFILTVGAAIFGTLMFLMPSFANATHFRGGTITWTRVSGNIVQFKVRSAWRSTTLPASAAETQLDFGDGNLSVTPSIPANTVNLGTFTDIAGEQYDIIEFTTTHTYATEGPFTAFFTSCCRISSLINAGDATERVEACVDLRAGNNGGAVTTLPIILQMPVNTLVSIAVPVADPDGDPIVCRMATMAESAIPTVANAGGFFLSVSPGCVLSWNTAGTAIGQKYAAQIVAEATHAGNVCKTSYDFIIEIVGSVSNNPPSCSGTVTGLQTLVAGVPFSAIFTGTDPDGDNLTVSDLATLPPGATLTPPSGTTQAEPFAAQFDWTPGLGEIGNAYAVTIAFTDPGGLQTFCSFSIQITAPVPVFFSDFRATPIAGAVRLDWRTYGDEDVARWSVYRRDAGASAYVRIDNSRLNPDASTFVDHNVVPGKSYEYVVGAVTARGDEFQSRPTRVSIQKVGVALGQNYPNPFNPRTTIAYTLEDAVNVELRIFNAQGKLVRTLASGHHSAGGHTVEWDGKDERGNDVSTGTYFYRLKAGNNVLTKKLVLLK